MSTTPDILAKIAAYKREEVAELKKRASLEQLQEQALKACPARGFAQAIRTTSLLRPAIIAEVKKASPSKGLIRADFDPAAIAKAYESGGAACLSVLTDGPGFQGSSEIFECVRQTTSLPLLRKDFMIDPIQITASRVMGADAVLVIMAMLSDGEASNLISEAENLGMDVLVETHTKTEVIRALNLGATFIGINNRDLHTFHTDLETFEMLSQYIPEQATLIAESGIFTREHIERMTAAGARGFLIGESLMRQEDVESAACRLTGL
ncbi:MAG: indole-3-glycerol phosphate synthase TrpC [Alphaproteobacteria bacterium]